METPKYRIELKEVGNGIFNFFVYNTLTKKCVCNFLPSEKRVQTRLKKYGVFEKYLELLARIEDNHVR